MKAAVRGIVFASTSLLVPARKPPRRDSDGRDPHGSSTSRPQSSLLQTVRSIERTSRRLEKVLVDSRRTGHPPSTPRGRMASGVRKRPRCALVVAENEETRQLLGKVLNGAGFFVEFAGDAREARTKAQRCAPEVVAVEHVSNEPFRGRALAELAAGDVSQGPLVVVTIDLPSHVRTPARCVTVAQRRYADGGLGEIVPAIVRRAGVRASKS
jgi:hypothetical protein